ncbi:hypothetical protein [Smaragdicoccus niigatensis]|uniref:hypothetical protein n=1 Tax=Smaragdicoccus niigatensis TaxID=359359 RepID=UPI000378C565|nr:hypothetical protein [Smaragdicoccus niigatensis]
MDLSYSQHRLLTDDEVLGIAHCQGATWPGMLPSVSWDPDARFIAALRGTRSLAVRGLADVSGESLTIDSELVYAITAITESPAGIGMHYSSLHDINWFRGNGTYFALSALGETHASVINPAGVHTVLRSEGSTADRILGAMNEIYSGEVLPDEIGLFVYSSPHPGAGGVWCTGGRIVHGVINVETGSGGRLCLDSVSEIDLQAANDWVLGIVG